MIKQDEIDKVELIFLPHLKEKKEFLSVSGNRYAHYTSAENAVNILQSNELWMRSPLCMNDYEELSYGYRLITDFLDDKSNIERYSSVFIFLKIEQSKSLLDTFRDTWDNTIFNAYISSLSIHHPNEDNYGRLSMWRAYGGLSAKAALVLNRPLKPDPNTGVLLHPALYYCNEDVNKELNQIFTNLEKHIDYLKSLGPTKVINMMLITLTVLALCIKHPGFEEEQEWRVIYLPSLINCNNQITRSVENISGVPQIVCKLPLRNSMDTSGLSLPELINRIIIGPTPYPAVIYEAFREILEKNDIPDPDSKIYISNIPLRT